MNNIFFRVGMTASRVIVKIVEVNPKINSLSFYVYKPKEIPKISLSALLRHDQSRETIKLKRKEATVGILSRMIDLLDIDTVLAVLSPVRIGNKTFHIPMMDFACWESSKNIAAVEGFLREIGQKQGLVLSTGRSYHYYGMDLLDEREWLSFLGKCLLSDLADKRYIGHRLIDNCGILRLSACSLRPGVPIVVSVLG